MANETLNSLEKTSFQNIKRLGRGIGSGKGKTSGKGHKGQRARSGANKRSSNFEGGQTPLYMRLPNIGFSNAMHATSYDVITTDIVVSLIESGKLSKNITKQDLIDRGLISGKKSVKLIMGKKPVAIEFKVEVDKASENAKKYVK